MNKMQFLAMSLPHGLIMQWLREDDNTNQVSLFNFSDAPFLLRKKHKPILHPLSDIKKEIEYKGEKFVPIEYLSMYANEQTESGKSGLEWGITSSFPFLDILKLIEWHFDICDLIEKGEAIDVNSLSENPYK